MSNEVKQYYQCRLQQGNLETTGWIEARGARVGQYVELLPRHEFWMVAEVFDHAMPEADLRKHQADHRKSLPSIIGN